MQLICNGVRLDLKEGAALSFKKSNILFAFDDMSCERSLSFDIPATAHNEHVFALAKEPAYTGEGMRRRFDAQLQMGIVVKNGYLYVDSYSKGAYKAVFVTGELVGLQALKNAGKIGDIWEDENVVIWDSEHVVSAPTTALWAVVNYRRTEGVVSPSFNVMQVTQRLFEILGKNIAFPLGVNMLRIVPEKKGYSKREVTFNRWGRDLIDERAASSVMCMWVTTDAPNILTMDNADINININNNSGTYKGYITQLVSTQELKITFPDEDICDKLLIASFDYDLGSLFGDKEDYYGDTYIDWYSRSNSVHKVGTLRRKTVTIPANTPFIIFHEDEYKYERDRSAGTYFFGWTPIDFTVKLTIEGSVADGSKIELKDSLPDYTVIDLLKIIAAYSGRVLNYTEEQGVSFDDLNFAAWSIKDYTKSLIQIDKVSRTFGKYEQSNIIEFDTDDSVASAERLQVNYTIDNDNLKAENTLQTIPLSEGSSGGIERTSEVLWDKSEDGASMLADCASGVTMLTRAILKKNSNLQALCDKSTSVQVTLYLPIYEWEQITSKTIIQIKGVRYVWTSGTWKNGKAQLELSAIA